MKRYGMIEERGEKQKGKRSREARGESKGQSNAKRASRSSAVPLRLKIYRLDGETRPERFNRSLPIDKSRFDGRPVFKIIRTSVFSRIRNQLRRP